MDAQEEMLAEGCVGESEYETETEKVKVSASVRAVPKSHRKLKAKH